MAHGGARPNAGRKTGSVTQRTRDVAEAMIANGELTPLDFLKSVYQDPSTDEGRRLDAAKAAAPYVHPRLANVDTNIHGGVDISPEAKRWLGIG